MSLWEKALYHQIHPLKLATDWGTGPAALYFFWQHQWAAGLLLALIPSAVASLLILRFANLASFPESRVGQYVRQYMTQSLQAARLAGYGVMVVGAWLHLSWLIGLGLVVIGLAWLRGVLFP